MVCGADLTAQGCHPGEERAPDSIRVRDPIFFFTAYARTWAPAFAGVTKGIAIFFHSEKWSGVLQFVIPAHAGIQRLSCPNENGATTRGSRFRGNDGFTICAAPRALLPY
jgi:hypothetical protein